MSSFNTNAEQSPQNIYLHKIHCIGSRYHLDIQGHSFKQLHRISDLFKKF